MKNYLGQTLWLMLILAALLTGLSLIPDGASLAGFQLKKMDIFSDIRSRTPFPTIISPTDSLFFKPDTFAYPALEDSLKSDSIHIIPAVDSSQFGKVIEDYTPGQNGLHAFFAAVDSIRLAKHSVRIAFFGDSFVEGDILLGDLRDTLQSVWGGGGVGFVPITSEVARFKRTLVHWYEHWDTYSIVKNHDSRQDFGISGFVYRPRQGAFVHYEGAGYFHHTAAWNQVRLFYQTAKNVPFVWQIADWPPRTDSLKGQAGKLSVWKWNQASQAMRAFAFRIDQPDSSLLLYGASLENGPGIYLDNFSVRGNTGGRLKLIRPERARQFDAILQYDLIIVQLGLNAALPNLNNIRWYRAELDQTFAHLRKCFPGKPILVLSVADRSGKTDGILATLPSVPAIAAMQRDLARQYGFLFYDLFHGMGGPGAMIRFASQKPSLANKDYTHLTHEGGKVVGHMLADLMLEAQTRHQASKPQSPSK